MNRVTCAVPVFYTTTEGQTRRIAERVATTLREQGVDSRALDIAELAEEPLHWDAVRGAIVGASLHVGQHQPAAKAFVARHAGRLNAVPSIFFSVSLSIASEDQEEVAAARALADAFPAAQGWRPDSVICLAGRLAYTQYNLFVRLIMKRIARKQGAPTDTSRDYEFTNWVKVDRLAREMACRVACMNRPARTAA